MKVVSAEQMRKLDRCAMDDFKIPGEELMDRAGLGVADAVDGMFDKCSMKDPAVLLVAGRGNNGGDAFAAARYLRHYGYDTEVWVAGALSEISGDARTHFNKMKESKVHVEELPTKEDWELALDDIRFAQAVDMGVVVDGVLGTGIKGPARGPSAGAISYINASARHSIVVAIDVPSGLNADTGVAEGDAVKADLTVTMGLPKRGLIEPRAADYVGRIEVIDIGIPPELIENTHSDLELITAQDLSLLFPRRHRGSHKGSFGHLLIIGGASGYSGAIAMAARAATRSGVGLVTTVVPRSIAPIVASQVPEAMIHAAEETEAGSLSANCWPAWRERIKAFSAVLVGPGLTRHDNAASLAARILQDCQVPLVMDADALNAFEGRAGDLRRERAENGTLVITPHPGELGRLMGCAAADIQADRFKAAMEAADKTGSVVIVKGAGTLVARSGRKLHINMTGNPGMASGGSGDVLAGLLGGILAQGFFPFNAAQAAVFLHGKAGDEAARIRTEFGMTASDLIEFIPRAFQHVSVR